MTKNNEDTLVPTLCVGMYCLRRSALPEWTRSVRQMWVPTQSMGTRMTSP